jgi:hypothetical protein
MPQWNWCAHCLPQWAAISPLKQDLSVVHFWILISYDNRVSFRVSGSILPGWLMCNFQFHDKSLNMTQKQWLTRWHVRKRWHSTWSCLRILCWDPSNVYLCYVWSQIKKHHRKILFWQRYHGCSLWQTEKQWLTSWHIMKMGHSTWSCLRILCWDPPIVYLCYVWSQIQKSATGRSCFGGDMVADSEHTTFICGRLVRAIYIMTCQIPSYMPNGDIPKKAPQK